MRNLALLLMLSIAACNGEIFTRDGVTDGDTFYLASTAFSSDDPALQSWVAYSLMKSACQLEIGGENPARASSFECEMKSLRALVSTWEEQRQRDQDIADPYLETLSQIQHAGFLAEYTTHYFGRKNWRLPDGLRVDEFKRWRRQHLRRHQAKTRIVGSWNYRKGSEPFIE